MAWSWSHSNEAYQNAQDNLSKLPRATLIEIYAEWEAKEPDDPDSDSEGFVEVLYNHTVDKIKWNPENFDNEMLIEYIWDWASEQATCDNGGYNAWMCPYGCGPHTVAFDKADKTEDDVPTLGSGQKWESDDD